MGFFSWIFGLLKRLFSRDTRYTEEKREEKDEKKSIALTKKQERIAKEENKLIKKIIKKLEKILHDLQKGTLTVNLIKKNNKSITVERALIVLIFYLKRLTKTNVSIKQEEVTLSKMTTYWFLVRGALLDPKMKSGVVSEVNSLFVELGVELKMEEKLTGEKIDLVDDEYKLLKEEKG